MKKRSPVTIFLLGWGLVISAVTALVGARYLIMAFGWASGGFYDSYILTGFLYGAGLGLLFLVPGIVGLALGIKRIRILRGSISTPSLVLALAGSCVFPVLLLAIAWASKPVNEEHLKLQYWAGRRSFQGVDLERAYLYNTDLTGANLARANLRKADLSIAYLSRADLRGGDLSGADLSDAHLSGANLTGADLSEADLGDSDLQGADLTGANLKGANLIGADLTGANLLQADLTGAKLKGALLKGATMPDGSVHE